MGSMSVLLLLLFLVSMAIIRDVTALTLGGWTSSRVRIMKNTMECTMVCLKTFDHLWLYSLQFLFPNHLYCMAIRQSSCIWTQLFRPFKWIFWAKLLLCHDATHKCLLFIFHRWVKWNIVTGQKSWWEKKSWWRKWEKLRKICCGNTVTRR